MAALRQLCPRFGTLTGSTLILLLLSVLPNCRVDGETLSVMSWNVENYTLANRMVDGRYRMAYPKPEFEKQAMREVIETHKPHILLFQEIGGDPYLSELARDLRKLHGLDYSFFGSVTVEDDDRKLGYLSRVPLRQGHPSVNEKDTFLYFGERLRVKRGLLELEVDWRGHRFILMSVHLKSRFTSDQRDPGSSLRRAREATLIRDYIRSRLAIDPQEKLLIVGDFNDHSGSGTYRRFTQVSGQPLLRELLVEDSNGHRWTYHRERNRRYEQIDFVFLSAGWVESLNWEVTGRIIDGAVAEKASDHRPILITIQPTETTRL